MTDRNERDADLIEQIERRLGMGHAAWDTIDPLEIAAAFREALAAPAEGDGAVADPADWPECSGNPGCCPENEGYGCCKPNSEAVEDQPPRGLIRVRDAVRGVVSVSKVFPGDVIAEEYDTRPSVTAAVPGLDAGAYFWLARVLTTYGDKLSPSAMAIISERIAAAPAAPKGGVDEAMTLRACDAYDKAAKFDGESPSEAAQYPWMHAALTAALANQEPRHD